MGGMSGQLKLALSGSLCLLVALAGWSWCLVASGLVGLFSLSRVPSRGLAFLFLMCLTVPLGMGPSHLSCSHVATVRVRLLYMGPGYDWFYDITGIRFR